MEGGYRENLGTRPKARTEALGHTVPVGQSPTAPSCLAELSGMGLREQSEKFQPQQTSRRAETS